MFVKKVEIKAPEKSVAASSAAPVCEEFHVIIQKPVGKNGKTKLIQPFHFSQSCANLNNSMLLFCATFFVLCVFFVRVHFAFVFSR